MAKEDEKKLEEFDTREFEWTDEDIGQIVRAIKESHASTVAAQRAFERATKHTKDTMSRQFTV